METHCKLLTFTSLWLSRRVFSWLLSINVWFLKQNKNGGKKPLPTSAFKLVGTDFRFSNVCCCDTLLSRGDEISPQGRSHLKMWGKRCIKWINLRFYESKIELWKWNSIEFIHVLNPALIMVTWRLVSGKIATVCWNFDFFG